MFKLTAAKPVLYALNFSRWKRAAVRLCFPDRRLSFVSQCPVGATELVCWGSASGFPAGTQVIRLEDGFIRSVGLGADLIKPVSWVIDSKGIYYDATRPSQLELLLEHHVFDEVLLGRAMRLQQQIVSVGLSKYNLTGHHWQRPVTKKPVLLVVGQVESDASVRLGSPQCQSNLELLRQVREQYPEAYLVYKPHPDVVAGLRQAGAADKAPHTCADEVVTEVPILALFSQVDEVHVMTSLAGFEALLRGVPVVCHGLPFYAGWGLTTDRLSTPRRSRKLSLTELVAATLILYPVYFDRQNKRCISPEEAIDELLHWRAQKPVSRWYMAFRRMVLRWIVGVR
jgi:capsular polysaccharide export protein